MTFDGGVSGAFGGRPFGEPPQTTMTVGPVTTTVGTGPTFSVSYGYSAVDSLPAQQVRVQVLASDGRIAPNGSPIYYDSGWSTVNVASGANGTLTVNAVVNGIPTDTGTGSTDPSLHLVVRVLVSYSADPEASGIWGSAESAAFDIQWGVPTLSWVAEPPFIVSTPDVSATWAFTDSRGGSEGSWEVQLTSMDKSVVFVDTGVTTGAGTTYDAKPVGGLVNNANYRYIVYAWNTNGVAAAPLSVTFVAGQVLPAPAISGGPLARFLDLIGFQLDISRSMAEQLRSANDPMRCPGSLIPALAQQLGVSYEAEMGMAQTRKLLATIVHQYKMKGTPDGVRGISTAVTGWPAQISVSANQMLSAVQEMAATASPAGTSTATVTSSTSGGPTQPAAYTGTGWPTTWPTGVTPPPFPANSARFNTSAADVTATMTWDSLQGGTPAINGVPVPPDAAYASVSTWLWLAGLSAVPALTLTVHFWDLNGNALTTSTSTPALAQNAWNQVSDEGIAVPAGAVWMSYSLSGSVDYTATNGLTFHAAPQVEFDQTLSAYNPPRQVLIELGADRVNLVQNPSFENNATTDWSATGSFTLAVSTVEANQPPGAATPGTHSLLVSNPTGSATQTASARTVVPVSGGGLYTLSGYVFPESTLYPITLVMTALDSSNNVLATVTSSAFQEQGNAWIRPYLLVPPNAPFPSNTASVQVDFQQELAAGEGFYIDDVMLEPVWALRPYFDADIMSGGPNASDYFWANSASKLGPSYYYRNYEHKIVRLYDVLAGIPRGGTSGTPTTSTPLSSTPSDRGPVGQGRPMIETGFIPLGTSFSLVTPALL